MDISAREVLIWLNTLGLSNSTILKLLDYFYDLREILEISGENILKIPNLKRENLERILNSRSKINVSGFLEDNMKKGIKIITCLDEEYPEALRQIYNRPAVLYYKGDFLDFEPAIAIVGSRKATAYGKWACEKFTKELVELGVTIISGLALGIDSIAHRTALDNGGRTIAILGNGIDIRYPKKNAKLYDEICEAGAIVSEFPPGTQPLSYNFPQRNRIISGLALAVIVVEAKERSGSLITAHHALEQGKDVFALPGNINSIYSKGTNKLIKDGAFPLLDIEDLLEVVGDFRERNQSHKMDEFDYSTLSDIERKIVELVKEGPIHSDMIAYRTGLDIITVNSMLTILEMKGIIKELTSRTYTIC